MEDNHCVIKDILPSNQLIEKVPMKSNHFFPLRIVPDMKGKTNIGVAFKAKSEEADVHCDKKENDNTEIQETFQTEVQDVS